MYLSNLEGWFARRHDYKEVCNGRADDFAPSTYPEVPSPYRGLSRSDSLRNIRPPLPRRRRRLPWPTRTGCCGHRLSTPDQLPASPATRSVTSVLGWRPCQSRKTHGRSERDMSSRTHKVFGKNSVYCIIQNLHPFPPLLILINVDHI